MKILLIMPDGHINKMTLFGRGISFREAPLTLSSLAALIPEELQAHITLVDRSLGTKVPYHRDFDLVGISLMTGTAMEGYSIAREFRRRGIPVILGGVHVTLRPEEAAKEADSIVTGFAEETWPLLLKDFKEGQLKPRYHSASADLTQLPPPRRDLQKSLSYMIPNTVMVTRGCRGTCEFCTVPAAGFGWQKRPIGEVIEEIRKIPTRRLAISDVHLTDDPQYAKEFLRALIPLKIKWGALASTRVTQDPELLDLLQKSGCSYLLLGFESFNDASLKQIHKGFNKVDNYREVVDKLHRHGITIQGCFIFGFDEDGPEIFQRTLDHVNDLKIDIPRYALFTPYPGTKAYERFKQEDRLLHEDWSYYDTQHVVIQPKGMTAHQLDRGLLWAYENTFKVRPSFQRSLHSGGPGYVTFVGNLAYKLYIKRLKKDSHRFPKNLSQKLIHGKG
ncbi:MAG: radical SAM protein [Spirochaetaceae bacterium]|jgi:radical SAM superfamily enzyme YgiQ (UPF0313 family)|nr:radical SAM protein [Spirochaetaceae bacterium]